MYPFTQFLADSFSGAVVMVSAAFVLCTFLLFRDCWQGAERVEKLALTAMLSPIMYILFCRLVDFGVFHLLRVLGFSTDAALFYIIRLGAATFVHVGVLVLTLRTYREALPVRRELSGTVYLSFMLTAGVAFAIPAGAYRFFTALALLIFLLWLLWKELCFLAAHDVELTYRHFRLPIWLAGLVVVGCMGEDLILNQTPVVPAAQMESTQGWVCVFGFLFALMILLLVKTSAQSLRETWETERSAAQIMRLNEDLIATQDKLIEAFSEILEGKSGQSGNHVKRVSAYSEALSRAMGLDDETVHRIAVAAMMHDCGKLMIPNEILEKPGRLTDEEFQIMRRHVAYGEQMLAGVPGSIMAEALRIANEHHERWDGKGYLKHLKGDEIALSSQIVAVADVFDALTSKRCYKDAWDPKEAYDEIVRNKGTQFSPAAVEAFEKSYDECLEIMRRWRDN
ncbi:MAG: HD domain-containing protein [Oscillospiraceae bacterium]|nr:HD domain-containing protein [Oscillospiraceae bacterium]